MKNQQKFSAGFELKFLAETGLFEGYASVFHVTDSVNDKIVPGAFRESLEAFKKEGRLPALLWQHDTAEPIGAIREMYEDSHGLFIKGELFITDLARAKEAHALLKAHVVNGLSIGYRARESHKDAKTGVRVLTAVDLLEISLVTFPANPHARVVRFSGGVNAAGHIPTEREFESILRSAGLSRRQAKGVMAIGYKALKTEEDPFLDLAERMYASAREIQKKSMENLAARLRVATAEIEKKFNPNQPRVPRGHADGGQWTETGAGNGAISTRVPRPPLPVRKPVLSNTGDNPLPARKPFRSRIPTVDEQALGHPLSPLDLIGGGFIARVGKPLIGRVAQRVRPYRHDNNIPRSSVFKAPREKEYLDRVRKLPSSIREIGKGESTLTGEQKASLKRFKKKNPKVQQEIEVTKLSDGSAIFTARKPADNIRGSYKLYDKRVDPQGKKIEMNAVTIGARGEQVNTKPK